MQLQDLLDKLNATIDEYNAEVDMAVARGDVDEKRGASLKVQAGSATVDLVRGEDWPHRFHEAVKNKLISEHPREILRLSKAVKEPTEITKQLGQGSLQSKGVYPVLVRTVDLAHLVARAAG